MIVNAVRMNHKITQAAHESFVLTATIMRIIVPTQNTMNGCGITCTIARSPPPAAKVIGPPRKLFVFFETGPGASLYYGTADKTMRCVWSVAGRGTKALAAGRLA